MTAVGVAYETANPFEFDSNGVPLAVGQLAFYLYGSVPTLLDTYQDPQLTTPNPNPIIADANGRFGSIWLSQSQAYQVVLNTAATPDNPDGVQIWSRGPYGPAAGGVQTDSTGIIGEVRAFAGPAASVPSLWYLCYGQAVSRATYYALFAVIGTTWGAGDGSTTFNMPDLRGRAMAGVDNMGGSPANRITSGISGLSGVTLGAAGGDQNNAPDTTLAASSASTSVVSGGTVSVQAGQISVLAGPNVETVQNAGPTIPYPVVGLTVDTTTTTSISSSLPGNSANVQPTAMVSFMIYAGA
jgi:microcystin-dependent protein